MINFSLVPRSKTKIWSFMFQLNLFATTAVFISKAAVLQQVKYYFRDDVQSYYKQKFFDETEDKVKDVCCVGHNIGGYNWIQSTGI